jgi:hypothetical protein
MKVCLLIPALSLCAFAQSVVEGTVLDESLAVIPGAELNLRVKATNVTLKAIASGEGAFRFGGVPIGAVELTARMPGFSVVHTSLDVSSDGVSGLKITLPASTVSEQVAVSASAEMLQVNRATQSASITSKELQALPTASRNYTHLIAGEAGVSAALPDRTGKGINLATSPGSQGDDGSQSLNPSVNGARPTSNAVGVNGVDTTNMMNGGGSLGNNITVPLDSLETVEVQTALYTASAGRNGGANIQMVTRGGNNEFHGSVSHFLQNEITNANEFFLNRVGTARPKLRRQETYAGLGGRIIRDKTFFHVSVQRQDFATGYATRATAQTGIPELLGDVRTRETMAAAVNQYLRGGLEDNPAFAANFLTQLRRFPADQIPGLESKFFQSVTNPAAPVFRQLTAADIHPVAINILNQKRNGQLLIPSVTPNMPIARGNGTFGRELIQTLNFPTFYNSWSGAANLEHNFSSSNRLRLGYVKSVQFVEEAFPWANSSTSPTLGETPGYVASLSNIQTFGSRWVNEFRGGFFELYNTRISKYRDILNSTLGINNPLEKAVGGLASLMPTIDINTQRGTSGIGNAWDFFNRQRVINFSDTVTHIRGRHTLQFGAEFRKPTIAGEYMARTNGDLDYDNWAFFLTGHGAAGGGSDLDQGDTRRHFKMRDYMAFFQDDWRVRKGLNVNFGARYEYFSWPTDTQGRIGTYFTADMARQAGVQPGYHIPAESKIFQPGFDPIQIGLVLRPGTPWNLDQVHKAANSSTINPDRNNVSPRIGFAWQPSRLPRTVIRGGYGIFYDRPSGSFIGNLQVSAPFFIYQNVPSPADMANPYPSLNINPFQIPLSVQVSRDANGAPSWRRYDGSAFPSTEPFAAKNFTFISPFVRTPYVQQWTFNVQYEPFRGNLIDLRYVGTKGSKLMARVNMAQPVDPRVTPVNGFTDIRTRTGALINPDFFVPSEYLGLGRASGFLLRSNWASSTYHAFQGNYRRRFAKGVLVNAAYTWSKTLDNISSDNAVVEQDARNIGNNRGPADFDRTHRFTAQYVIDIPNPIRSQKLLLGGWSLNGGVTLQSGAPFSITGAATANAYWAQVSRVRPSIAPGKTLADVVKSGSVQNRVDLYYDPTAFVNSDDQWGNLGRNILRGPAQRQVDMALAKTTRMTERVSSEFRWEVFNLLNQATFSNPAAALPAAGYGTMGQITSTIGGPRTMQLALRLKW